MFEMTSTNPLNWIIYGVIIAAIFYLAVVVFMATNQARFIYIPKPQYQESPITYQIPYDTVAFKTVDNETLYGWYMSNVKNSDTILFCHGNFGNMSYHLEHMMNLYRMGYSLFCFDYRGFGQSEGTPSEHGTAKDIQAAWRYLVETKQVDPQKIIIYGHSLGAAIALQLRPIIYPKAFVLEGAFVSIDQMAQHHYPFLPVKPFLAIHYNNLDAIKAVKCPLVMMHSPQDGVVPYAYGQALFKAAPCPKQFIVLSGDHNSGIANHVDQIARALKQLP